MERIVLGFAKDETAGKMLRMLSGTGYEIAANCHSKADLIRAVRNTGADIAIMGFKLYDATVNDVFEDLPNGVKLAAMVKAEQQQFISCGDIFIIPLPVNRVGLVSGLDVLTQDLKRHRRPKRSEEDKKVIDKAKRILMEKHMMSEEQAHRFIQKRSMDTASKAVDTAKFILSELGEF